MPAGWLDVYYSLSIQMLSFTKRNGDQFIQNLKDFILFCCLVYVKQYFICPSLEDVAAALNDLQFCKTLKLYHTINDVAHNAILTNNEDEKQRILQVIDDNLLYPFLKELLTHKYSF